MGLSYYQSRTIAAWTHPWPRVHLCLWQYPTLGEIGHSHGWPGAQMDPLAHLLSMLTRMVRPGDYVYVIEIEPAIVA